LQPPLTWVEIDLAAYGRNVRALKALTRPGCRLMAVVKADGYGHGAVAVARTALREGANWLGVARVEEAIALREAGLEARILIFGFTPPGAADLLLDHDLTPTVFSAEMAEELARRSRARGERLPAHVKVDTGMGRLGLVADASMAGPAARGAAADGLREVATIAGLPGLELEGVYTHFATADSADQSYARLQLQRFGDFLDALRRGGVEPPWRHAANSAALIDLPESHLDLVRPGIATYGLYPSSEIDTGRVRLAPALTWKTRIVHLKRVPAGFGLSYGLTYRTPRPTTIATVAVGYADGLDRRLSSRGQMLAGGRRVPIVGRICMDLTLLDVGDAADLEIGDEAVVIGRQGDQELSAAEMATELDTISYEVVSTIAARVPRIYSR
jgi:alanine racemase